MGRFKNYFRDRSLIASVVVLAAASFFLVWNRAPLSYIAPEEQLALVLEEEKVIHIKTPESVRAIYMTSWVAGTRYWREDLVKFIDSTELNAVVIDVKDYTGRISFEVDDSYINELGSVERKIPDIKDFIKELHEKGIYVIGRISAFQDPYFVKTHPEMAVKKKNGSVWKDYKGLTWVDPAAKVFWNYVVLVAKESERAGFDELNFDYVRFPSDGNMRDIKYDYKDEKIQPSEVIKEFFGYLRRELGGVGDPLSADLFGMTTVNYDDLDIMKVLENVALYFYFI